jgi:hypothetical protein
MTSWANLYEWGGYNNDSVWQFNQMRPTWTLPIHQLMVKNNVTIFFQGHDHLFCQESKDCIIYQEVPQPSAQTRADNPDTSTASQYLGQVIGSSGYLHIQVSPQNVSVQYVKTGPPESVGIAYNYTVSQNSVIPSPSPTQTPSPTPTLSTTTPPTATPTPKPTPTPTSMATPTTTPKPSTTPQPTETPQPQTTETTLLIYTIIGVIVGFAAIGATIFLLKKGK